MIRLEKLLIATRTGRLLLALAITIFAGCGGGGSGGATGGPPAGGNNVVSGTVTSAFDDAAVPGVTVRLSGAAAGTTTTAASGQYSFSNLANGSYTLTVSLADAVFDPETRSISVSGGGAAGVDFLALRGAVVATGLDMLPSSFVSSNQLRASLLIDGTDIVFTDSSDAPLRRVSADGTGAMVLAPRFSDPGKVALEGGILYWINGPSLMQTLPDGTTSVLATGRGDVDSTGVGGIIVDNAYAYWVDADPSSPCSPSCVWDIQRIPLGGGAPETLATADRQVVALAADASRLYWAELGLEPVTPGCNCGSEIRSVAKSGGVSVLLVDGTLNGALPPPPPGHVSGSWMPTGGVAVTLTEIVFAAAGDSTYTLHAVPLQGGNVRTIASVPSTGGFSLSAILDLRVSGTRAYWIATGESSLRTVLLAGGPVTDIASGLLSPGALAINGASAIWTEAGDFVNCCRRTGAGRVRQVPLAGGAAQTLVGNLDLPVSLAVDAQTLYWTENWRVARAPRNTGVAETLFAGIESSMAQIARSGADIYVLDGGLIKAVPLAGGMARKVAAAHFGAIDDLSMIDVDIVAAGDHVYWTVKDVGGSPIVQKVANTGGVPETIAMTSASTGPQDCQWRLMIDAQNVYWSSGSAVHPIGCRVNSVPIGGGAVRTVVDQPYLADFTLDAGNLYFSEFENDPSILRTTLAGGALTPVATSISAWVLANNASDLYWLDLGELTIGRISKAPGTPTSGAFFFPAGIEMDPFLAFEALHIDANGIYVTETTTGSIYRIY